MEKSKNRFLALFRDTRSILSMPRVTILMDGDYPCHELFQTLTSRHPRYKIIRNKSLGAALALLPDTFDEYLEGRLMAPLRQRRRKAIKSGYRFGMLEPLSRIDEILDINMSMTERQNRPMSDHYRNIDDLKGYFQDKLQIFGVFDKDGSLVAYAHAIVCGEVFAILRILGHGDHQSMGVMYLLVSEMVQAMIERRNEEGRPNWLMYDTYYGALPGLRTFKRNLGLQPYHVRWQWRQ